MPDERLAQIAPVVDPIVELDVVDRCIVARRFLTDPGLVIADVAGVEASILNGFDGDTPIGRIAQRIACEFGFELSLSFFKVRSEFLRLCSLGVCLPDKIAVDYRFTLVGGGG